jgi:O-antigen/teichoic acid export membrane protein
MALNAALSWTFLSMIVKYVLKIFGNWVLARLLMPEAFGISAIVFTVLTAVELLTDSGVGPSLIRSRRTDDVWLNTVWTFQILRGLAMSLLILAIAYPVARFYSEPQLGPMIASASLITLMNSMVGTGGLMAMRNLQLKRYSIVELGAMLVGYAVMIPAAWYWRSAWALIVGAAVIIAVTATCSYFVYGRRTHKFTLDREALRELVGFGLWMMLTSAIGFALFQGDRLIVGKVLGVAALGVYFIAQTWAGALNDAVNFTVTRVFLPAMSTVHRADGNSDRIAEIRNLLSRALVIPMATVSASATALIAFLYKPEMQGAGPVLQIMVATTWLSLQETFYYQQFMAEGNPSKRMPGLLASIVLLAIALVVFWGKLDIVGFALLYAVITACRVLVIILWGNNFRITASDVTNTAAFLVLSSVMAWFARFLEIYCSSFVTLAILGILTLPPAAWVAVKSLKKTNEILNR